MYSNWQYIIYKSDWKWNLYFCFLYRSPIYYCNRNYIPNQYSTDAQIDTHTHIHRYLQPQLDAYPQKFFNKLRARCHWQNYYQWRQPTTTVLNEKPHHPPAKEKQNQATTKTISATKNRRWRISKLHHMDKIPERKKANLPCIPKSKQQSDL